MKLVKYNEACRALTEAKNIDEVKTIRDKSEAMRAYGKMAKNRNLEIDASEIRIRAERRLGELIKLQKETVGLNAGARGVGKSGVPLKYSTLKDAGIDKKLSSRSQKLAAVPEKEFESKLKDWRVNVEKENERITTDLLKIGEQEKRNEVLKNKRINIPDGLFNVILADPPWQYSNSGFEMSAEKQYPIMDTDSICNMPIPKTPDDAILFLWITNPLLEDGLRVCRAWGFEYKTNFVWTKERHTAGFYVFGQHELLLICTKGAMLPSGEKYKSIIKGNNDEHSKKPDVVYEMIESMYPDTKRVELFARCKRKGWESYGNEL